MFSLLAVKLHLLGQGHLVELIKVKYLRMSSLLYLLLQAPQSLQRKRDISFHSNGTTSNLQQTDKLLMAYIIALSAAHDYLVLNE